MLQKKKYKVIHKIVFIKKNVNHEGGSAFIEGKKH